MKAEVCVVYDTGGDYMYLTVTSIFIVVMSDCGFVCETGNDYVFDPWLFFFLKKKENFHATLYLQLKINQSLHCNLVCIQMNTVTDFLLKCYDK